MWKPKLRCPKCGGRGRPRKHYEKEQCECVKCGYTGKREEFEKEPLVRRRAMKLWRAKKGDINVYIEWVPPGLEIRARTVRQALERAYPKGRFTVQEIITRDDDFVLEMPE